MTITITNGESTMIYCENTILSLHNCQNYDLSGMVISVATGVAGVR